MHPSELNRKLLFYGYGEVTDYLKNSPLNRFLYKKIVDILNDSGITVPPVTLFNEIYYQCVRVNYDGIPGADLGKRYLAEEEKWVNSSEGALVVFCVVGVLLSLKRNITFQEECFLNGLAPYIRNCAFRGFAEELYRELRSSDINVPDSFPTMTCPVSEIETGFTLTKEQYKSFWGVDDPGYVTLEEAWHHFWAVVTCDFSHSVIEQYVRLYSDPNDQLKFLSCIGASLNSKTHSEQFLFLKDLSRRITTGCFEPEGHPFFQPTVSSGVDVEEMDGERSWFPLDAVGGSEDQGLAKRYRQERDELLLQLEEAQKAHAMELARQEARYKSEIKKWQEDSNRLIRWPLKKRPTPLFPSDQSADVLVFSINDVAEHVKERFSRSGAEEVCTMLYRFAVEYGCLSEETFRQIDSIVPAILKRDTPHQIFELSNVQQFNNNPGTVVNNG